MKKIIIIFGALFIVVIAIFSLRFLSSTMESNWLCRDGQWIKHGHPRTPPPAMPCAKSSESSVRVLTPQANERVSNPIVIKGKARGSWYFEGSFPVRLENLSGRVIASGTAKAQGEWMTDNFVPFTAEIDFTANGHTLVNLILLKANPSGLPENDDSFVMPLVLNKTAKPATSTENMLAPPPIAPPPPPVDN